jgi:xanthine dehydrogenase YagS FAD-binding subunit
MRPFVFVRSASPELAISAAAVGNRQIPPVQADGQFLAGGTTIIDLMKLDVMRPKTLVDINPLQERLGKIQADERGLRLGSLVRMAQAAEHDAIKRDYPVIAETLNLAASQQIRNMASLGGNVLQRTRCTYFRDVSWNACNKRNPGSGCAALGGESRKHAILGTSNHCIASYPGDFAQALMVLDAHVDVGGPHGLRSVAFADLHRVPANSPNIETQLAPGELILGFIIPAGPWTRRSHYLKIRDRESYEFALASAAVALQLEDGIVRDARIALGGVATIPWRAREAEAALKGQRLDEQTAGRAADAAFAGAKTTEDNAYKVPLGKQTLVRALLEAGQMEI